MTALWRDMFQQEKMMITVSESGDSESIEDVDLEADEMPWPKKSIRSWIDNDRLYFFQNALNAKVMDDSHTLTSAEVAAYYQNQLEKNKLSAAQTRTYDLSTQNLSYKVAVRRRGILISEKLLLNNITAQARHGEILAISGPSGASKTTFLDALAGRINRNSLTGTVLVNGEPMNNKFKRISSYVMQDDALFPVLTVRETLMFSARLRLPSSVPTAEKNQRVENILDLLGLRGCAETQIGNDQIGGVSGGERRRVSIGIDVIHDPSVLFLDEPTSGLDSTSALLVMQSLSKMARERKRTIILTMHQPSYRILETIDNTLVLAKGNVVFHGHHGDMIKFLSGLGFVKPEHVTVMEYMMDKIEECEDIEKMKASSPVQNKRFGIEAVIPCSYLPDSRLIDESEFKFANSMVAETIVLSSRNFKNNFRIRTLFLSRVGIIMITSLIMATLFFRSSRDEEGLRQRQVFFAFTVAILIFTSTEAMAVFLLERQIFIRETSRGAYRTSSYVLSHSIVVLPFLFFLAILCTVLSYFAVGLASEVGALFMFAAVLFLVLCVANAFVAFVSGIAPNFISGLSIVGASSAYFFLLSGFFVPKHSIPKYWLWLHYGSFFKYPYESLLANEFKHLPGQVWYNGVTSENLLSMLNLDTHRPWFNIVCMLVFLFGYRFLFYVTLRYHTSNIRF